MKKYYTLLTTLLCLVIGTANSQVTVMHNFNDTMGVLPYGDLTLAGNRLFGTAYNGGLNGKGCVYSIDSTGGGFKDIFDFNGSKGQNPIAILAISGATLYGTTAHGGANNDGCVFSMDTNGTGYKDLLDFNITNGKNPFSPVLLAGNVLYGMTDFGGANDSGRIYSIHTDGTAYKDLFDFSFSSGTNPMGALTLSGGKLFGMTAVGGGSNNSGTIFSIDTAGGGFKTIFVFDSTQGKDATYNGLIVSNGQLFGMTTYGGKNNFGAVFSIDTNGSNYKKLLDFNGGNGSYPYKSLTLIGSTLFGTANEGGLYGDGCIFSIDSTGNNYKDIVDFYVSNGEWPTSTLLYTPHGFYGTTTVGGTFGYGVVFKLDTTIVASVNNIINSNTPVKLYPDPNDGRFTISVMSGQWSVNSKVEVYDVLGQQVYSKGLSSATSQLSIEEPAGVYLYRIISDKGDVLSQGRFVIEK